MTKAEQQKPSKKCQQDMHGLFEELNIFLSLFCQVSRGLFTFIALTARRGVLSGGGRGRRTRAKTANHERGVKELTGNQSEAHPFR